MLVADQLRLPPRERIASLLGSQDAESALDALRWLANSENPVIVIGGIGAALLGAPQRPESGAVEVVPADLGLLATELGGSGFAAQDSPERWAPEDRRWPWTRDESTIVIASGMPGTTGYKDLRRSAQRVPYEGAAAVDVAHPRDLLRLAEASSRGAERARIPGLRVLLEAATIPA